MAEEHENELKTWHVPRSHGKWYYPGAIAVLMAVISILVTLLWRAEKERRACQNELRDLNNSNRDYLEKWADKAFDERYKEKEQENTPKVEELKAVVDSIKNKKI